MSLLCPLSDKGQSLASQVTTRRSQKFLTEICPLGRGHQVPSGEGDSSERACWSFFPIPNCNAFHLQLPKGPPSGKFSPQSPLKFPEDLLPVTKRDSPGAAAFIPTDTLAEGMFVMHSGRQLSFCFCLGLGDIKLQTGSEEQPTAQALGSLVLRAPVGISGFFHPEHSVAASHSSIPRPMLNTRQG